MRYLKLFSGMGILRENTYIKDSFRYSIYSSLIKGSFLFLFLYFFEPFGAWKFKGYDKFNLLAVVSIAVILIQFISQYLVLFFFKKKYFPVYKFLITTFLTYNVTGLIGAFIYFKMRPNYLMYQEFVTYFLKGVSISLLPLFFVFLIQKFFVTKTLLKVKNLENRKVYIKSMLKEIKLKNILAVEGNNNYVFIHHLNDDQYSKRIIRSTLKELSSALPQKTFFECHRSYLINKNFINNIVFDGAKTVINIEHMKYPIPVARSKKTILLNGF